MKSKLVVTESTLIGSVELQRKSNCWRGTHMGLVGGSGRGRGDDSCKSSVHSPFNIAVRWSLNKTSIH